MAYNFITIPGPEFAIPTLSPQFVFVFTALIYDLYPRPWPCSPALAPNLYLPALAPNLYFPALAPNLCLPALTPNLYLPALVQYLYLPALAPNLYLPDQARNLYLPTMAYNFITIPGPEFAIPTLPLQFVFVFTAPVYDLYYRSGA